MLRRIAKIVPVFLGLALFLAVLTTAALAASGQSIQEQDNAVFLMPVNQGTVTDTTTMTDTDTTTATGAMTGTAAMTATTGVTATTGSTGTMAAGAVGPCAQTYVVQPGDSLSSIAAQFGVSVPSILSATTEAAATDTAFTAIDNPDVIVTGQTFCIPAASGPAAVTSTVAATPGQTTTTISGTAVNIPAGKGQLLFENLGAVDLIVDLIGPAPESFTVAPSLTYTVNLDPGAYDYNAHQPGGDFVVEPGGFTIVKGGVVRLSCSTAVKCQVTVLSTPQLTGTTTATPTTAAQPAQMETTVTSTGTMTSTEAMTGTGTATSTVQPSTTVTATEAITK